MIRIIKLVTIFLMLSVSIVAQKQLSENEERVLSMADDTSKVNALIELARSFRTTNTTKVFKYSTQALEISEKLDYPKGIALSKNRIASFFRQTGDYERAIQYYNEALDLYQSLNDTKGLTFCLNGIGGIYRVQKNYDKALEYYQEAFKIAQTNLDSVGITIYLRNIGLVLTHKKQFNEALNNLQQSLEIAQKLKSTDNIIATYQYLAECYDNMGDINQALIYYQKALELAEKGKNIYSIPFALNRIGRIYIKKRQFVLAEECLHKALAYANKLNVKIDIKEAYEGLTELYQTIGNYEKAYQSLKLQTIYNDSIFSVETNSRIATIESVFEIERQKNQIALLNQKNTIKEERIKLQGILMITLTVVFILSILNLYLLRQKNKKLHEAQNLLIQQNEELQQSKEQIEQQANTLKRLSTIAHKTINAVMILKPNGDIEWVNQSFTKLYGYTLEEFKSQYHYNLTQVSRDPEIAKIIKESIYTQKPVIYNVRVNRIDGSPIWIQTSITPIFDENGKLDFFVAIDTDITSLKEYETNLLRLTQELKEKAADLLNKNEEIKSQRDNLIELNEQLQQKNAEIEQQAEMLRQTQMRLIQSEKMASIGGLIAGIAHEINNPTNFVYVGATILEREFAYIEQYINQIREINNQTAANEEKLYKIKTIVQHPEFQETLSVINETLKDVVHGAERTAEIIKKMQFYSRFEQEKWQLCDINQIFNNLTQDFQQKNEKKLQLITQFQPEKIFTSCLLSRLTAALHNILQNAVDASDENGKIEIKTWIEGTNALIEITDTGKGIEPDNLKKIFDPFFTTKPVGSGIGLGLTISYGIIKEHGGNIAVHSTPKVGTTVRIELPIVENRV